MSRRWAALCWAAASALSCSGPVDTAAPAPRNVHLAPGLAAQVASDEIALSTVTAIARAQQLSLPAARDLAARDAVFAAGARLVFGGGPLVPVVERAAWARALLEAFKAEAATRGPASDAEVTELSALHWQDFDRPETVRTTHAVAIVSKPEQDAAARSIAEQLYAAVRGASDPEEFIRLAKAVPHEGVDVRAERLPALTRDGRTYYPEGASPEQANQRFDEDFARAAHRLAVGQIGEPAKSVFGYHVILCEARLPEKRVPFEERRALLASEVMKGRAERAKQELLARLTSATPILLTRSVDDLTARVQVGE
ncbi:MAG TPA: peptidyl-prolyl cis-trans isomerase [Polyangiaceae bacterium]|nr:peptidyl-prolyl cis-trans isomerase [Polyangiaceae bacterium]